MLLRDSNIARLQQEEFDVAIIGGGINGAVSAAALSARGAKVALIERGDFACETSQESSNLAWGGIKYLESFEFGLVRKLCRSRNHLMKHYPSTVKEIRFLTTHAKGFRQPRWMLYLGTWIYWLMGNAFTQKPRWLSLKQMHSEVPVLAESRFDGGIEYSDAYLHDNDARFVFNFVRSALNYGCIAANYVESLGAEFAENKWNIGAVDKISGQEFNLKAGVLLNTCGPYVEAHNRLTGQKTEYRHVFSKGIHLIVDRIVLLPKVLTFFANDGRMFFAIPMGPKTCIGTTDSRVESAKAKVDPEDRRFVLDNINERLNLSEPLSEKDIIAERCGVRPLVVRGRVDEAVDWVQLSRKHVIEVDAQRAHISVFGGKLTDCLNVGEEICAHFSKGLGRRLIYPNKRWYGEPIDTIRDEYLHQAELMKLDAMTSPDSSELLTSRLWRRYGAQALGVLERIREDPKMAEVMIEGTEYLRAEISLAAHREMIIKLEDFLRRRSKIALIANTQKIKQSEGIMEACRVLFGDDAQAKFAEYFDGRE
jgi:glycerol-3-phosphate dehydrogenase